MKIRHNYDLIDSDLVLLFNGREVVGHYCAVSRVDQSKLKSTSIYYTKDFDNQVDSTEVDRRLHRLEAGSIVVKGHFYALLVAKGEQLDEVKEDLERVKRENKKLRKSVRKKRKLIRNMKRLLGTDKNSKDDDVQNDDDDDNIENIETQSETEPELPTHLQVVTAGDVLCDICRRTFPGTGSLRKHIDKMHKGKGKFKCPKCKKVYITKRGQTNCELKHKGSEKPFECDVDGCIIRFYNMRSKKKHEKQQHGDHVEEKNKLCAFEDKGCSYRTHTNDKLFQHQRSCKFNPNRVEYKCELCGKGGFYHYKKVQEHKRRQHKGYN